MLEKDPQRVRAFDDGLMDAAGHTAGAHKRQFPFILTSLKGRDHQSPGHPIPVVHLQQDENHGEDDDDNYHNGSNDGSRTYEERGGNGKCAN